MYLDYPELTSEEAAVKDLDEIICLFRLYDNNVSVIENALEKIAAARKKNSNFPVTLYLYNLLIKKGLLSEGD